MYVSFNWFCFFLTTVDTHTHTLKCPLTVWADECWQQVCDWDTFLTALADVGTQKNTKARSTKKKEKEIVQGNCAKYINRLKYLVEAGDRKPQSLTGAARSTATN